EGMFVQLQGSELPVQAELQISFFTAGPARNREHRMPACVVHGNEDGVGLMLRHVDYRDFHVLRYMINAA
ncbi:MAG TPA: hypothetical protein VK979_04805, partial [Guyparkeria sp.]|nr:hypothetical protein [Guyparkeria sp.]